MAIRSFIFQHIDALIPFVGGLWLGFKAFCLRAAADPARQQSGMKLQLCALVLIVLGAVRFLTDHPVESLWRRCTVGDGAASAEFPSAPTAEEKTDTLNGISVHRSSLACNLPAKGVTLLLSVSPFPDGTPEFSSDDRFAALKDYFSQQGCTILREAPVPTGTISGFALDLKSADGKSRTWMRVGFAAGKTYRVVASSSGSDADDPLINRFLDSFRIDPASR